MTAVPIADAGEREAALDPSRSCIVQAPAGSGKTGLLIQRVLRLLAGVERPEQILAITFTRKAAAEMRRRVLEALQAAATGAPAPESANARLTSALASAALARDRELGWRLLDNPARLRIQTIDSLCASLARQMPVLSGIGAAPAIVEDARELYREAAERTLARLEGGDALAEPLGRLLAHLDGDWAAARTLLEAMLSRGDQWLRRVAGFEADAVARTALEDSFRAERSRILARLRAHMPAEHERLLARVARFAAANLAKSGSGSPVARLAGLTGYPAGDEDGAAAWCAIAELLLVAEKAQWRKSVDRRHGFPSDGAAAKALRNDRRDLLERFAAVPGLCEALHAARRMPPPAFTDRQWDVLGAVVAILPQAAAELRLVFAERGEIDFTGLTQAALAALGEEDDPTDLLLALDVRLRHLLVDEFQDTSRGQWELLAKLTAGWAPGDGRTVFLVGDPMQSIYRFREADVALFLRAREQGLPQVALGRVRLATNFRSQEEIVSWINGAFAQVLSPVEDADEGAVPYARSSPHHPPQPGLAVQWHAFAGRDADAARDAEALAVVEIARSALAAGREETVAVLVRNRSHLDRIVPALKAAAIRFRAVDIEPLGARPIIQDLLAITRALSHLGDRVAWLALLRAPWCALTVAELHALAAAPAGADDARGPLGELLADDARLARLGAGGRERAARLRERLAPFVANRARGSVRERVEGTWLALGGPACADGESDLEDAETFFEQLDELERGGDIPDPARLERHLDELHAAPDSGEEARLQLMTIHKAKGLEFGTVILPGLDRLPRHSDRPLFAWKARADGTLMMAPTRAAGESEEAAYDYLRALDDAASQHEASRLLYVAATRAQQRLHLLGFARLEEKSGKLPIRAPSSRSLLGKAWSVARERFEQALPVAEPAAGRTAGAAAGQGLRALAPEVLDVTVPAPAACVTAPPSETAPPVEFSWVGETARHVGVITHRWLQRIAIDGLGRWNGERVAGLADAIRRDLARRGVPDSERPAAIARVLEALEGAITDERGRWVLESRESARSEYRLRVASAEGVRLVVIDRTFVDREGRRWIVDYKSGFHEGGDRERFLEREIERYRPQLAGYAAAFPGEDVALGLYFPLMKAWRELAR